MLPSAALPDPYIRLPFNVIVSPSRLILSTLSCPVTFCVPVNVKVSVALAKVKFALSTSSPLVPANVILAAVRSSTLTLANVV